MRRNDRKEHVIAGWAVALMAGLTGMAGCASIGSDTRKALNQSKLYEWRTDGSFWTEAKGPQTETFDMEQTETAYREDGSVESVTVYRLSSKPSGKDATTGMATVAGALVEQSRMVNESAKAAIDLARQLLPGGATPEPPPEPVP